MYTSRTTLSFGALCGVIAVTLLAGCDKKGDPVSVADRPTRRPASGRMVWKEVKAIAEEGFIYGLPIVMNYTVMYEFWVDRTSGQCDRSSSFGE